MQLYGLRVGNLVVLPQYGGHVRGCRHTGGRPPMTRAENGETSLRQSMGLGSQVGVWILVFGIWGLGLRVWVMRFEV